jgi:hypothetical protein
MCGTPWPKSALTTSWWPFLTAAMRGVTPSWSLGEQDNDDEVHVRRDGEYDKRDVGQKKNRKGDAPFSSMSRGEAWGRSWFTLLRSPPEHAWDKSETIILKERD